MKKYIIVAVLAIGLGTTAFALTNKIDDKCNCSQTEVCSCKDNCECTSC